MRARPPCVASVLPLVLVLAVVVPVFAGCSQPPGDSKGQPAQAATDQANGAATSDAAGSAEEPAATPGEEPLYTASYKPNGKEIAVVKTAKGVIKFKFYPTDAPNTVAAFIELAKKGFYDGTKFHRVEPGFVIQGGDPLSKTDDPMVGTGGPGYRLKAEFDPATNTRKHLDGAVAMARSASPDSAGSQFYITLGAQPGLDGQYTVFGQVTEGMDVVRSIQVGDVMESVSIENSN